MSDAAELALQAGTPFIRRDHVRASTRPGVVSDARAGQMNVLGWPRARTLEGGPAGGGAWCVYFSCRLRVLGVHLGGHLCGTLSTAGEVPKGPESRRLVLVVLLAAQVDPMVTLADQSAHATVPPSTLQRR